MTQYVLLFVSVLIGIVLPQGTPIDGMAEIAPNSSEVLNLGESDSGNITTSNEPEFTWNITNTTEPLKEEEVF